MFHCTFTAILNKTTVVRTAFFPNYGIWPSCIEFLCLHVSFVVFLVLFFLNTIF